MLIYDVEIVAAIPPKETDEYLEGIEYCGGWEDKASMGVAVICAWDSLEDRYRVFCEDNFKEFEMLVKQSDPIVGFNSITHDDVVCGHVGLKVHTDYDLLQELWVAAGLGRKYEHPTHAGFGLDAVAIANLGTGKTMLSESAPVLWQRGEIGAVIDYCLEDVRLTKLLMDNVLDDQGRLVDPRDYLNKGINEYLTLHIPSA